MGLKDVADSVTGIVTIGALAVGGFVALKAFPYLADAFKDAKKSLDFFIDGMGTNTPSGGSGGSDAITNNAPTLLSVVTGQPGNPDIPVPVTGLESLWQLINIPAPDVNDQASITKAYNELVKRGIITGVTNFPLTAGPAMAWDALLKALGQSGGITGLIPDILPVYQDTDYGTYSGLGWSVKSYDAAAVKTAIKTAIANGQEVWFTPAAKTGDTGSYQVVSAAGVKSQASYDALLYSVENRPLQAYIDPVYPYGNPNFNDKGGYTQEWYQQTDTKIMNYLNLLSQGRGNTNQGGNIYLDAIQQNYPAAYAAALAAHPNYIGSGNEYSSTGVGAQVGDVSPVTGNTWTGTGWT